MRRTRVVAVALVVAVTLPLVGSVSSSAEADAQPVCAPGGPPVRFDGHATPADARTYLALPFTVAAGTTRVEVTYDWANPQIPLPAGLNGTTFDLGLWDTDGLGTAAGFRGWSGSRAGRRGKQPSVYVQQDVAQRGYRPAPIDPGTWWVDLGIAAIDPLSASVPWDVSVVCTDPAVGPPFVADPVDASHIANTSPGWYDGDFHMHGVESNLDAPSWQAMVDEAKRVGLDFMPITDYVTGQQWDELGPIQRANPDMLLIPGREIITYFGHANAIGETRDVLDYRHGFPGVSLADIQRETLADGAMFQVNHPTIFPGPVFSNFCRGCNFELSDVIDWDHVDTFEVLTGPASVSSSQLGLPDLGVKAPNPFMLTAMLMWQRLLLQGHRITAVSGSDSKGIEPVPEQRWGTSATAVYADSLSRADIFEAVRAGHAYVRTLGVHHSPSLELTARRPDGTTAMMGDTVVAPSAPMTATVRGGLGQLMLISRDGLPWPPLAVPITSDPFTYTWTADRASTSGPLGTFWRVDVASTLEPSLLTVISNPIFLSDHEAVPKDEPPIPGVADPAPGAAPTTTAPAVVAAAAAADGGGALPTTGGSGTSPWVPGVAVVAALVALAVRRRGEQTFD